MDMSGPSSGRLEKITKRNLTLNRFKQEEEVLHLMQKRLNQERISVK
jgi:hypothetical protein